MCGAKVTSLILKVFFHSTCYFVNIRDLRSSKLVYLASFVRLPTPSGLTKRSIGIWVLWWTHISIFYLSSNVMSLCDNYFGMIDNPSVVPLWKMTSLCENVLRHAFTLSIAASISFSFHVKFFGINIIKLWPYCSLNFFFTEWEFHFPL